MMQNRIMYVCEECWDSNPENCGHFDRRDLRVMPDGRWICDGCFDDMPQSDLGWSQMAQPPEYGPLVSHDGKTT